MCRTTQRLGGTKTIGGDGGRQREGGREKRRGRSIGSHGKVSEEESMKKNSKGSVREEA